jgi:uncharacterized membrane protein YraQ (UPF0718 family)
LRTAAAAAATTAAPDNQIYVKIKRKSILVATFFSLLLPFCSFIDDAIFLMQ